MKSKLSMNTVPAIVLTFIALIVPAAAAEDVSIHGNVRLENTPLCALVLANGQRTFSCEPRGEYTLNVPLGKNGEVTVFCFASGMEPYQATFTPPSDTADHDISMQAANRPITTRKIGTHEGSLNTSYLIKDVSHDGAYVTYFQSTYITHGYSSYSVALYDNRAGGLTRFPLMSAGGDLSPDGRYFGYTLQTGGGLVPFITTEAKVLDIQSGEHISLATLDDECDAPELSGEIASGYFAVMVCRSDAVVPGDTNASSDVFVKNISTGEITRIDYTPPAGWKLYSHDSIDISDEASRVLLAVSVRKGSYPDREVERYALIYDRVANTLVPLDEEVYGAPTSPCNSPAPTLSGNGRYVVFQTQKRLIPELDGNGYCDVYVYDIDNGEYTLVSVKTEFSEPGQNTPKTVNADSFHTSISSDGRYVTFVSDSGDFLNNSVDNNGENDLFLHDRVTGETKLISVASDGLQARHGASHGRLSGDGRWLGLIGGCGLHRDEQTAQCPDGPFIRGPLYQTGNR